MIKTKLSQKILLLFLGTFAALVFLEVVLRLGGYAFILRQDFGNKVRFSGDEFRILCIGESTTALGEDNSYPAQLEKILQAELPGITVKVVNKGLVSKNTKDILDELGSNLDKYRPQLVIAMLGINDPPSGMGGTSNKSKVFENILMKSRVLKLFRMISLHLANRIKEIKHVPETASVSSTDASVKTGRIDPIPGLEGYSRNYKQAAKQLAYYRRLYLYLYNKYREAKEDGEKKNISVKIEKVKKAQAIYLVVMAVEYRGKGSYEKAIPYLRAALELDPRNYGAYVEMGKCLKENKQYKQAANFFFQSIPMADNHSIALLQLAYIFDEMNYAEGLADISKRALSHDYYSISLYQELGELLIKNRLYESAKSIYLKLTEKSPKDFTPYQKLSEIYRRINDYKKAEEFASKAEVFKANRTEYHLDTVNNYKKIINEILGRGMKLIIMQYPLRGIEELKEALVLSDKKSSLYFLENADTFRKALAAGEYSRYFSDSFAGDFGHCTRFGNQLISKNAADLILKEGLQYFK
ncbi:MAG: tetratricopeptide repeat protein [Candidatus Omnitrophica bacterium]|nr:tetratricopeptide repeat protein [Candidatus Omnitrophota bacterium]